ncbi:hypothetical protein NGF19_15715 [Streptomyces sp. RY43-2]|uniref:Integral membrane protein n=1 Tax=Streptomyces macrolidinus TaxID=2952607 RepID=A0ABT0ZF63_9ACTN|nr:hypothetical protein [Streptomyces macrolidinus]MCN9242221.1 hypothetical protein [Streptomyces macrolidinus]
MRTTPRRTGAIRLWRWRANPLKRRSDRVEGWIILTTWLVALLTGVLGGLATTVAVEHGLAARRAGTHRVTAALTQDATASAQAGAVHTDGGAWAKVRWKAPDGSPRTAVTRVDADLKAGAPVTLWTDRSGEMVPRPATAEQTRTEARLVGALVGLSAAGGVLVCGRLVRARLERQRMADWDHEWELVEPRWRRTPG